MENEFTKPMSEEEFQAALAELGFSMRGLMRGLGRDEKTARRWGKGTHHVPIEIACLLRVLIVWKEFGRDPLTVIPAGDGRAKAPRKAVKIGGKVRRAAVAKEEKETGK